MEQVSKEHRFNVLGHNVKLRPQEDEQGPEASEVVAYVNALAEKILRKNAHLDKGQVATLVALQLASEKLSLDSKYKENVKLLQSKAHEALECLEEVTPLKN